MRRHVVYLKRIKRSEGCAACRSNVLDHPLRYQTRRFERICARILVPVTEWVFCLSGGNPTLISEYGDENIIPGEMQVTFFRGRQR
jgi:hypothetical protein